MEKKKFTQLLVLLLTGIIFYAIIINIGSVMTYLKDTIYLLMPVTVGLMIAFVLNVPMHGFEKLFKKLTAKWKKKPNKTVISGISFFLTLICLLGIITLAVTIVGPKFVDAVVKTYNYGEEKIPELLEWLKKYNIDTTTVQNWLKETDLQGLVSKITSGAGSVASSAVSFATSTVSGIINIVFAIIVAAYVLLAKESLGKQLKKLLYAVVRRKTADKIIYVCKLTSTTYSKFFSGQCIEAFILGAMIFVMFTVFGIPYAAVAGVITALSAFVPYIGAVCACVIAALLTAVVSPSKIIICVIVYTVTQFCENQFIYPHVVGNSVGLSALWTLIAALVGGKLFGLFGIVFFIPLFSVLYTLLRDKVNEVLKNKKIGFDGDGKEAPFTECEETSVKSGENDK